MAGRSCRRPRQYFTTDGVVAGAEAGDLLARAGPEDHLLEADDALELVLGDLHAVDDEHAGHVVAQVDGDGVDQAGELAALGA